MTFRGACDGVAIKQAIPMSPTVLSLVCRKRSPLIYVFALLLMAPSWVLAQAESEPNDTRAEANALAAGVARTGSIGADGDRADWYGIALPAGGSVELAFAATSTAGTDNADAFVTVYRRDGSSQFGGLQLYDVPDGATARDTFRLFGRAPGDSLYVRISQQSGSLDYELSYTTAPPTTASDPEPNDTRGQALSLPADQAARGQIGYALDGGTDREDWYGIALPAGGSLELAFAATSTAGTDQADAFVTVYRRDGGTQLGGLQLYNVPGGQTARDTFRLFGRAPGDSLYVRISQQSGSLDYALGYTTEPPGETQDREPNDTRGRAIGLVPETPVDGQIGYTLGGGTDRFDWYGIALPAGGSVEVAFAATSTAGTDQADGFVTVYRRDGTVQLGGLQLYNVPDGQTARDTFRLFGRAPGDSLYVRVSQQSGSLDYTLSYRAEAPPVSPDAEPNDTRGQAAALTDGETARGQIGYTLDADSDRFDWYAVALPASGTAEFAFEATSDAGTDQADAFVTVYRRDGSIQLGGLQLYNIPNGQTARDTFRVYGRTVGDSIYVRVSQQSGAWSSAESASLVGEGDVEASNCGHSGQSACAP